MKAIGYYNPFPHPISFTGRHGNMVEVSPNTPVTNSDGFLVEASDLLDSQVQAGLLKRIYDTHPDFKDHNRKVEKRKGVVRFSKGQVNNMSLEQAAKVSKVVESSARPKATPQTTLDAKKGVIQSNLPEGAVLLPDGTVDYNNKKFASASALSAYLKTISQSSPNPLSKPIK